MPVQAKWRSNIKTRWIADCTTLLMREYVHDSESVKSIYKQSPEWYDKNEESEEYYI